EDARGLPDAAARAAHADDAHPEGPRRAGDRPADVAETDDREGLPEEPVGQDVVEPAPLTLRLAIGVDALRDPRAPADDVLGHPRSEDSRGARDDHARRELADNRPVHARAHRLEPSEPGRLRQEVRRELPRVEDLR